MFSGWLYLALEWVLPIAMTPVVVRQHRRPFIAIAWLGCIFAFPPVGVPIYFVFSVFGIQRRREATLAVRREYGGMLQERAHHDGINELPDGAREIARVAYAAHQRTAVQPLFADNDVTLLSDDEVVERLCADIRSARNHVHLLFFIFAPDATGRMVADALIAAVGSGCTCRVLVDAFGSRAMLKQLAPEMRRQGVAVVPVLRMRPLTRPLRRHDVRNHRKIAVIDGSVAYTGSSNIHGAEYDLEPELGPWHQISARIAGPAVAALQTLFLEDWTLAADEQLAGSDIFPAAERPGPTAVQVIADGPTYPDDAIQQVCIQAVNSARSSVLLVSPYFVPDEPLIVALCCAALRGVRVRVLVPKHSDRRTADLAGRASWETLLQAGVQILEHGAGVLHVKAVVIDDRAVLFGTANLDRRSFFLNYELMLFMPDARLARELQSMLSPFEHASTPIDLDAWRARDAGERWRQDFAKLLSPLL